MVRKWFADVGCPTQISIVPKGVGIGHSRCPKQCRVSVEEDAVGTGPKEKMIGRETTKKPRRRLGLQRNRL
ncbi:hypothetical protein IV203_029418 [Nitzschia inconspicua]|uniref:Uncharacterized protein n=1 Tax=Nitzschia inconspicua TaxID=303405 RepID=A0A9K3KPW0_9STRA|nr:hypothetical protein IV203_016503 [Nitzschia inconspicua]KAG7356499.1 hypothetical protein IV203_001185 [Nitzschia inconspicua]KAG7366748.1 hypothetical protein IV203_029418 [Nitzschia inconspicua]